MGFLSVKVVLISTGILSMAMGLKLTLPLLSDFVLSEAPSSMWSFLLTWLTPPYLYILLNCIILTIVASSKFHHSSPDHTPLVPTDTLHISTDIRPEYAAAYTGPSAGVLPKVKISGTVADYNVYDGVVSNGYVYDAKTTLSNDAVTNGYDVPESALLPPVKISGAVQTDYNGVVSDGYVHDANVPAKTTPSSDSITNGSDEAVLTPTLQRKDSLDFAFPNENEKPLVSARFGHRKAVRGASPEGGGKVVALGVAKPKRQDTLESTWRTITDGRAMPLTRHLKKSDTWDSQPRRNAAPFTDLNGDAASQMKKSETFSGRSREQSASPVSGVRLRKEPSLSQDELNRRVEAFINKFNAEMRLQRQESLRQYREMINRGAH